MESNLDDEIADLQAKVSSLKTQLRVHTSTLITAPSTRQLLTQQQPQQKSSKSTQDTQNRDRDRLTNSADQHQAHAQQCLYRACASLTTFRARDPDPHAVDGGAVLGLRIEVVSRSRFLRPYYVLLNRPYQNQTQGRGRGRESGSRRLRVHRHTIPSCVPLAGLAARYLPGPAAKKAVSGGEKGGDGDRAKDQRRGKEQDLARFARALRRELVRYHHRLGVVADLRKAAELGIEKDAERDAERGEEEEITEGESTLERRRNRLVDITPADAGAKQLTIEWADGRTGRLVMSDDGDIVKLVVLGDNGRDWAAGRDLLGGATRVEDVIKRLTALA
ncbi:Cenp-O kinetochore centromere component-domain-containing protein [Dichotomopilus funicola]|uniref:Cenp-O kinetochore centromere component-domain-containing protein n=1 Tax=Dichotomopilus funicola TaxID=1934379 RepID=A0AAN6V6F9_9PEZI|nr:Cenp-O kinetochore centromere component-domain-containing protein [Dichotomopilus funicola]